MSYLCAARRRATATAVAAGLALTLGCAGAADAAPKQKIRFNGQATVVSVDGPTELTLRAIGGRFKARLEGIDAPKVGECGATEAQAALSAAVDRVRGKFRYVKAAERPDADGRWPVWVGPRRADLLERSLARDLVRSEWARPYAPVTVSEADGISMSVASDDWSPRAAKGLWAACGGMVHLPAGAPVPTHAPATWAITRDGVTEAIGPITLPAKLAPGSTPTVADVTRVAATEIAELSEFGCLVRVPSLEVMLFAAGGKSVASCATAELFAVATTGPGAAPTTVPGVQLGAPASVLTSSFPRMKGIDVALSTGDTVGLFGPRPVSWAWQTQASISDRGGAILGLLTSASTWRP